MEPFVHTVPIPIPTSTSIFDTHARAESESESPERGRVNRPRPSFTSKKTDDRLKDSDSRPASIHRTRTIGVAKSKPRRSVFREEGLHDLSSSVHVSKEGDIKLPSALEIERSLNMGACTLPAGSKRKLDEGDGEEEVDGGVKRWYSKIGKGSRTRPVIITSANSSPRAFASIPRVAMIGLLIAVVLPAFRYMSGDDHLVIPGADAGVIRTAELVENGSLIEGRANSPTDTCTRWAHQIANVNGTVYIYGGQSKQESGQINDTWNNNLLTLDLTKTWKITSPALTGLTQPSGPPAVAMGSLWHSWNKLWVYGGLFSDTPPTTPSPVSTWEYDIKAAAWTEYTTPLTSAGNFSDTGNTLVQRAAEGASLSVPELGRSWYFGGHLDSFTTTGWSNQIARVYLKSLLEFTQPGYANTGVTSLGSTTAAGAAGVYRNITEGGLQDTSGFTERADGVLVYVPGWGDEGIILGLAGGTNQTMTEMNIIDVFDISTSTWYKQATSGTSPPIRVDPCAVVASAPDGTSFNIYLYGGQNLIPYGSQIQYSDMWILTIPSFTWVQVDMTGQSQPPARAGHSCTIWDGQMVIIGGYVGKDISCDSPGVYVFNASSLQWATGFTSISGSMGLDPGAIEGSSLLRGSVGYQVPGLIQSIIGGSSLGGATATIPAAGAATIGPIATGKPPTFTVTSAPTIIQTAAPTSTSFINVGTKSGGTNVGAAVAGSIAGVFAILAAYLAWCTWLYRRQLAVYRDHVAMAQRAAFASEGSPERAAWGLGGEETGRGEKVGSGIMLGGYTGGGDRNSGSAEGTATSTTGYSGAGGGVMTGSNYEGEGEGSGSSNGQRTRPDSWAGRPGTANGSMDDLLGGQEPSFFSVVLNPRRTLRVVNAD